MPACAGYAMSREPDLMRQPASPSRTDRYTARVGAHLPTLRDDTARREFISREIDKWEEHYARFKQTEGESHRCGDGPGQPTAFDFVETIAALAALQARYSGRKAA
jgi:hypothetical protein